MTACRRDTASCAGWMSEPASRPIRTILPTTTQRLPRSSSQRRTSGSLPGGVTPSVGAVSREGASVSLTRSSGPSPIS